MTCKTYTGKSTINDLEQQAISLLKANSQNVSNIYSKLQIKDDRTQTNAFAKHQVRYLLKAIGFTFFQIGELMNCHLSNAFYSNRTHKNCISTNDLKYIFVYKQTLARLIIIINQLNKGIV